MSAGGLAIAAAVNVDVTGPQAVVLGLAVFFNFLVSAWITSIVGFALLIAIKGAH